MFLISKTFSRQHPFPLMGQRPPMASNIPSEVPATTVATLKWSSNDSINYNSEVWIGDGEQGWYRVKVASASNKDGDQGYYGYGHTATYSVYLCPGTYIHYWGASSNGTLGGPDGSGRANYGASGTPWVVDANTKAGAGAGAVTGSGRGGGGAGFVAELFANSETQYRCGKPVVKKTMTGYSQCPSFVYLDANGNPITLTTAPSEDSDLGYAYTGYIPDPASTTGGTIAVIGFLQDEPIPYVGQEVKVYYQDDQTVPFYVTTVAEAPKDTVYCKTCHGNLVIQGYAVYNTTGTKIGYVASVTQNFRGRTVIVVQYSGRQESYMLDPNVTASFSRQVYYGWEIKTSSSENAVSKRIFWTNSETTGQVGKNGLFAYELVNGTMCICTVRANTADATRRADLDTVSDTVAFGVTSDDQVRTATIYSHGVNHGPYKTLGTGAYCWVLAGGGGYWDASGNYYAGGAAFGSILQLTQAAQTGGYNYDTAKGPGDSFGGTGGKQGSVVVVDCNDAIAYDTVDAVNAGFSNFLGANRTTTGYTEIYKLSDSNDVTEYGQKIYFPASSEPYTCTFKLNNEPAGTITIPRSLNSVLRYFTSVKQGDTLEIVLTGDNDSTEKYIYDITTETIAFGIQPGAAPWKIREFKEKGDYRLGFAAAKYGAILISGGGAGGGINQADGPYASYQVCGRGGTSIPRILKFENTNAQVGTIHVGKGGNEAAGSGGTSDIAARYGTPGGQGGEPSMITFEQNVNVESMPIRLYSFTNGSTVMYTRNNYPDNIGGLVQFCDSTGALNGKVGYRSTQPNTLGVTCSNDGLFYEISSYSGNANIDIDFTGATRCIFNIASGGGGGAGGISQSARDGAGGGGGGGGGCYRVDMYNRYFYATITGIGGAASSGAGGVGNTMDGPNVTGNGGESGAGTAGGAGGVGYGAGGGAGGRGNNHSGAYCGKGGGGAPGNELGGWGIYRNGVSEPDQIPHIEYLFGKEITYGRGGYGYDGANKPASWYSGTDGYIYLYRFETITEIIDCGAISAAVTETIDCGSLIGTVDETIDCGLI